MFIIKTTVDGQPLIITDNAPVADLLGTTEPGTNVFFIAGPSQLTVEGLIQGLKSIVAEDFTAKPKWMLHANLHRHDPRRETPGGFWTLDIRWKGRPQA